MTVATTSQTRLARQVVADLERHEGFREYAYPDPLSALAKQQPSKEWGYKPARQVAKPGTNLDTGKPWTYGFGFTHGVGPDSRIDKLQAERRLEQEVLEVDAALSKALTWYGEATFVTKTILINMAFNMGLKGLLGFNNTLRHISQKNYEQAAHNMTLSLWYKQVGSRAKELVERMRTQQIPAAYTDNTRTNDEQRC